MEYKARKGICAACVLRPQCTRAKLGRTVKRHEKQAALDVARAQAHSCAARRNRRRRQQLMERSFADAANNHHFKRSRCDGSGDSKFRITSSLPSRTCASYWPTTIQSAARQWH
jgi:hypothetical protein